MHHRVTRLKYVDERADDRQVALDESNAFDLRTGGCTRPHDADDLAARCSEPGQHVAADESSGARDHDAFTCPTVHAELDVFIRLWENGRHGSARSDRTASTASAARRSSGSRQPNTDSIAPNIPGLGGTGIRTSQRCGAPLA